MGKTRPLLILQMKSLSPCFCAVKMGNLPAHHWAKAASVSSPVLLMSPFCQLSWARAKVFIPPQGFRGPRVLEGSTPSPQEESEHLLPEGPGTPQGSAWEEDGEAEICELVTCAFFHPGWEGGVGAWDSGGVQECLPHFEEQLYLLAL